ncbi:hypothetical protein ACFL43_06505 [Thermodesulfobacteriota bacterium]
MAPEPSEEIVAALSAIPDGTMRLHSLITKLDRLQPEAAARLLQTILRGAGAGETDCCLALACIDIPAITEKLGNAFMSEIYDAARRKEYGDVVKLLLRPPASRTCEAEEPLPNELPAGVRISRSKTQDPVQIDTFINDSSPMVIRTLLRNPRLTERELLKLCSKRPVNDAVLREVYENKKWVGRYSVKKALVLNPYCPTEIGLKLIHFILVQDLRLVAASDDLHPLIRETAREKAAAAQSCDEKD